MIVQKSVADLLQKLLNERFEAGRMAGYDEAIREIAYAVEAVEARLTSRIKEAEPVGDHLADHPGDENDAAEAVETAPTPLPRQPYLKQALEYLKQHPAGVTAHQARDAVKNRAAFRELHHLGFVEKRGPKFFPKAVSDQ